MSKIIHNDTTGWAKNGKLVRIWWKATLPDNYSRSCEDVRNRLRKAIQPLIMGAESAKDLYSKKNELNTTIRDESDMDVEIITISEC